MYDVCYFPVYRLIELFQYLMHIPSALKKLQCQKHPIVNSLPEKIGQVVLYLLQAEL